MAEEQLVFVNVQMPIEIDQKLRLMAANLRISRSEIVRVAVAEFLDRYDTTTLPHPPDAEAVPVVMVES